MKKLLLFLLLIILVVIFSGHDLHSFVDGDNKSITVYENERGKVIAETVELSLDDYTVGDILKQFYTIYHFTQNLDDIEIIYAYSPVLKGVEFVDKKPINLQITVSDNVMTLSSPLNIGSF